MKVLACEKGAPVVVVGGVIVNNPRLSQTTFTTVCGLISSSCPQLGRGVHWVSTTWSSIRLATLY